MKLEIKEGYEFKEEIKELFTEYTNTLIEGAASKEQIKQAQDRMMKECSN